MVLPRWFLPFDLDIVGEDVATFRHRQGFYQPVGKLLRHGLRVPPVSAPCPDPNVPRASRHFAGSQGTVKQLRRFSRGKTVLGLEAMSAQGLVRSGRIRLRIWGSGVRISSGAPVLSTDPASHFAAC